MVFQNGNISLIIYNKIAYKNNKITPRNLRRVLTKASGDDPLQCLSLNFYTFYDISLDVSTLCMQSSKFEGSYNDVLLSYNNKSKLPIQI